MSIELSGDSSARLRLASPLSLLSSPLPRRAERRGVDPPVATQLRCRATKRFSRMLHCENLSKRNVFSFGSVQQAGFSLDGFVPLLHPVVLQLSHQLAGLGWDLNLKPTPGAWPYGTGASHQSSKSMMLLCCSVDTSLQVVGLMTVKARAMISLEPCGTQAAEM